MASHQGFGELKTEQLGGHSQEQQRHRQAPIDDDDICTTPTRALEIIVGLEPLTIFMKQEAMLACYCMKVNSQLAHTLCGHTKIDNQLATNVPLSKMRGDKTSPKYVFDKNYTVSLPNRDD